MDTDLTNDQQKILEAYNKEQLVKYMDQQLQNLLDINFGQDGGEPTIEGHNIDKYIDTMIEELRGRLGDIENLGEHKLYEKLGDFVEDFSKVLDKPVNQKLFSIMLFGLGFFAGTVATQIEYQTKTQKENEDKGFHP